MRRRLGAVVAAASIAGTTVIALASPSDAVASDVVGTASTPDGTGWWTVDAAGDLASGGSARTFGSLTGMHLDEPVVGMASTPDGLGYWLVATDGGIFSFGDARFFGSTGGLRLDRPIVGLAPTSDGGGYWMVASDGGVFSFGDARFFGSTGGIHLDRPIIGIAPTSDGGGYWMVASDGGIFSFGDARFFGSTGGRALGAPIVGMASSQDGGGYWIVTSAGTIYPFGDATPAGSIPGGQQTFGLFATPGGGYTVLTSGGPEHLGPMVEAPAPPPAPTLPATPPQPTPVAAPTMPDQTGLTSTIGTAETPQIVRVGTSLREVDPADPRRYLPGTFKFSGDDAFELTTDWSDNVGCGTQISTTDMDWIFHQLGPDAVIRTWMFQSMATNRYTGQLDWAGLDRVVQLADQDGVHLIATLGNQDGTCDEGNDWKDPTWYSSGFAQGTGRLFSYEDWVKAVVTRYAGDPAIMAWEPINEPRPDTCTDPSNCWPNRSCPSDAVANQALRGFFDTIGADIRSADPNHLISDGAPAGPYGCGTATWQDMAILEASPGIDLMSQHDYTGANWMSDDLVNGYTALSQTLHKPFFVGENGGINATGDSHPQAGCDTMTQRAQTYQAKITNEYQRLPSLVGWLLWDATYNDQTSCVYETWGDDPIQAVMAHVASAARVSS